MTPGFPALASPPKPSAPAFARSTAPARTPALPPAAGRARFGFAACDPYFPILRGPALREAHGNVLPAQRPPYLSVACWTPVKKASRHFILTRAVQLSLDSLQVLSILRLLSLHSLPGSSSSPFNGCVYTIFGQPSISYGLPSSPC